MPVTLIEAKAALSPYVDNGVCSTDTRVTARINEAQRRLHSMRAWLGVLARYSVTVSGGQFVLPAASGNISTISGFGLESAIKVSSTTAASGFLTNSVQAFLADSGDILSLNFISSSSDFRTYSIEGNAPERVEVTGKLNYVAAVADTDLLVIDDLDALKLMILALYREENNQLDLAQALENKAVERLTVKTDRAIESARRINYQTKRVNSAYGTLGYFRSKLALDLSDGLRLEDGKLVDVINRAIDLLLEKKRLLLSAGRYGVKDGLSLPTFTYTSTDSTTLAITNYQIVRLAVLSLLTADLEAASKYEAEAVKILEEDLVTEMESKRHAQYSTALTTYTPGTLGNMKARLAFDLPNGLKMSETELSNLLNTAEETLFSKGKWFGTIEHYKITVDSTQEVILPSAVGSVLAVSIGDKPINVFDRNFDYHENGTGYNTAENTGSDVFIDRGEVFSAGAWKRRYFVRNSYPDDCFNILVKKRWLRKNLDTSAMDIRNYPALKEMVLSILSQDPNVSDFHANRSEIILKKELSEARGGARNQLRVQAPAFARGDVQSLL
jgi:hypothetical protein